MAEAPIVTLTLNPALDLSSSTPVVSPLHKLRCSSPLSDPGGGGINVSRVCHRLGEPTVAVAPLGGPLGQLLATRLGAEGVACHAIPIAGETRMSVSITEEESGAQYRFVFPGPELAEHEWGACLRATIDHCVPGSRLVISGSLPVGVDPNVIAEIIEGTDVPAIVDSSGPGLQAALAAGAFLVKPSARELAGLVGRELLTEREVTAAAEEIVSASNVAALVVSIGAGGAILATPDQPTVRFRAPTVRVESAVGAGDSMVAGIAVGLRRGLALLDAVALGVAAGTAAVLTPSTELCRSGDVERLRPDVVVD